MLKRIILLFGIIFIPVITTGQFQTLSTHSILGTVTFNGLGLKGVTVAVQGTTLSAVTDGLGNYAIHSVPSGSIGDIVPTLANYSFSPVNIPFINLTADLTGQNFTATQLSPVYYSISGNVMLSGAGLAGALITFGTFTATTATDGTYSIANIPSGTKGRIVPSLAGYAFTPTDITVTNLSSDLVNQNFTASLVFTISGKVTDVTTLLPVGGVLVTFGSLSAVSNITTGAYEITNIPAGTSGVLTPTLKGELFTPSTITVTSLQSILHSQDFVAAP